ncbi:hypothetical protein NEOLEDRAFT_1137022 [Neolentinus lepideus HHB14362 ss-1]|uniref:Uncharacterized protein n=1 Tax=Neolentinus lepideus HHB14362 ss-1 TaxID=1314782 RepID=A0A165R0M0_9AGAM|nr:hypothetical protein NEOLEDRAFT_1137022 [Neolentinus lepideus HHB14362 ss-1]
MATSRVAVTNTEVARPLLGSFPMMSSTTYSTVTMRPSTPSSSSEIPAATAVTMPTSTTSSSSGISPSTERIIIISVIIGVLFIISLYLLYFLDRRTRGQYRTRATESGTTNRGSNRSIIRRPEESTDEIFATPGSRTDDTLPRPRFLSLNGSSTTFAADSRTSYYKEPYPSHERAGDASKHHSFNSQRDSLQVPVRRNSPRVISAHTDRREAMEIEEDQQQDTRPPDAVQLPIPPISPTPASEQNASSTSYSPNHKRSTSTFSRAHTPELRAQIKILKREMETLMQEKARMDSMQQEIARMKAGQPQVDELQSEVECLREDRGRIQMLQAEVERLRRNQDRMEFLQQEVERLKEEQQEMIWELQNLPPPDYEDRRPHRECVLLRMEPGARKTVVTLVL